MIEIRLRHRQGNFLIDLDLQVEAAGITGLIGPSGAGKSTLFQCLAGHRKPAAGRITINGHVLFDSASRINLHPADRRVGVVFQEGLLFPHMSVRRNLGYGAPKGRDRFAAEVVDALDLGHLLDARPQRLSGGERQRAAIARALIAEPDVLLLDEPVSALDPGLKARTMDLISRVQARTGTPMIYISHAPEEIRALCSRVITLHRGTRTTATVESAPRPGLTRPQPAAQGLGYA
ncbi:ATP-binding cassette domain-containing protein [Mangrovicoccus sp. HB161399]|uniref:ATP-binding cassette domain-containing protein n=1 Tax=Mangrovicoccus sp. HB161399 TaxID=2720392 RepID=UPI001552BE80|nr:ATP-binding cassette domain-containing protein [Mangrovicoccus sp. HB161399]